jgi:hypothetical protein
MANEQHRAARIQSEFQKLLDELKEQDDAWSELADAGGFDLAQLGPSPLIDVELCAPDASVDCAPIPAHALRA